METLILFIEFIMPNLSQIKFVYLQSLFCSQNTHVYRIRSKFYIIIKLLTPDISISKFSKSKTSKYIGALITKKPSNNIRRSSIKAWLLTKTLVILFPFSFPPKKRGKKKRRMNSKNRDQKSCLSAWSMKKGWKQYWKYWIKWPISNSLQNWYFVEEMNGRLWNNFMLCNLNYQH